MAIAINFQNHPLPQRRRRQPHRHPYSLESPPIPPKSSPLVRRIQGQTNPGTLTASSGLTINTEALWLVQQRLQKKAHQGSVIRSCWIRKCWGRRGSRHAIAPFNRTNRQDKNITIGPQEIGGRSSPWLLSLERASPAQKCSLSQGGGERSRWAEHPAANDGRSQEPLGGSH